MSVIKKPDLTDPKLRAIFDQWGEKGLKEGVSTVSGGSTGRWVYNKDPNEQFSEFFGSTNPFASFFKSTDDNNALTL